MVWRLYDTLNGCWYNDKLYDSREACLAVDAHYMQAARAQGEVLALVAEPLDPADTPSTAWSRRKRGSRTPVTYRAA
jgi:hypothetical protein